MSTNSNLYQWGTQHTAYYLIFRNQSCITKLEPTTLPPAPYLLSITDKGVVYNAYSVYVDTPLPLVAVGHTYFK